MSATRSPFLAVSLAAALAAAAVPSASLAEQGILVVSVRNPRDQPVAQVQIGTESDGALAISDVQGRARIRLGPQTRPGEMVTLQIVPPPDLVLMAPYHGRTPVPSFENRPDNYVSALVMARGDPRALDSAAVLAGAAARSVGARRAPGHRDRRSDAPAVVLLAGDAALERRAARPLGLIRDDVAEALGFSRSQIEAAMARFSGDSLAWKAVLLTANVEFGDRDPYSTAAVFPYPRPDIEFGIGWWGLRRGALQKLLQHMRAADPAAFAEAMDGGGELISKILEAPPDQGAELALSEMVGGPRQLRVAEPWRSRFRRLGATPAFQQIQMQEMGVWVERARAAMGPLGLRSERGFAFCYDTIIESGPTPLRPARLQPAFAAFTRQIGRPPDEQERLLIMANLIAARPGPSRLPAVRQRLLTFARGEGVVFGRTINLEDAGLGLRDVATGAPVPLARDAAILDRLDRGWAPQSAEPQA